MRRFWITLVCLLMLVGSSAWTFGAEPETLIAYRRAAIETMGPAGRLENATLLIRGNKIEAVGTKVVIPDHAQVIDAVGQTIMPGLIEPLYEVAVASATADSAPRTVVIRGRVIQVPNLPTTNRSFTRVADSFYPYDTGLKPLNRMGLTTVNLITNGMGQGAVIRLTPSEPEQMLWVSDGAVFANITNNSDSLDQLRLRLDAVSRMRSTGSGTSTVTPTRPASGDAPPSRFGGGRGGTGMTNASTNIQLWLDLYEGKIPLVLTVNNSAAIAHVLKLLEPHKNIKLALYASGDSLFEARDALKGKKVHLIIEPGLDLQPNSRDRINVARMMHEDGHTFSFSLLGSSPGPGGRPNPTDRFLSQDFPLFPVAMAVKTGLPRQAALAALTQRPANLLGLEKELGTLEPGKIANLLIFDGDPLDPSCRLRATLIEGKPVYAR